METMDPLLQIRTSKQQADKAIHSLKGILLGINLDGIIDRKEIDELKAWILLHKKLIERNPFKEFMLTIEEALCGDFPNTDQLEDIYWLSQKYESESYYFDVMTSDLQILQGICHGILANGQVTEKEIIELKSWLIKNNHLASYYPYDEIRDIVTEVLKDKKVDDRERKLLKEYFGQFVKLTNTKAIKKDPPIGNDPHVPSIFTNPEEIQFYNNNFCITGLLQKSSRKELESKISMMGGLIAKGITPSTHYLIVGDNSSPAWAYACYGRKIEKVISLKNQGVNIPIIKENLLLEHLVF